MKKAAFSLVELSIVLVILGLLVGGVLSGQSLIRAAEMRTITSDYQRFIAATQTFRDKYFALPGDMTNATAFWGAAHATPATCATTASTSALTCNGNGDGQINPNTNSNETYRFWQHLANATLIEGNYNGITQGSTNFSSTAANSPRGRASNTLWFVWNWGVPLSGEPSWFDGSYGNRLSTGVASPNSEPSGNLKADEAWNIDTKMDDGRPGQGKVMTQWTTCTNAANSADVNTTYRLDNTNNNACLVMFPNAF